MKVLFINSVCGILSTGRICADLAAAYEKQGHEVRIAYGRDGQVPPQCRRWAVRIGNDLDVRLHGVKSRIFDAHGLGSAGPTKRFLQWADEYDPDLLWLHNIHGYYINYELLFAWIKERPNMEVKWTLHDCWAFTGHCTHFQTAGCDRWKTGCHDCPQKGRYPASFLMDRSRENYEKKKKAFTRVDHLTILTPSHWLENLVKESFLKEYPVEVQYNKVDTNIFKPTPGDFRERYGLAGKKIVLGVSNGWDRYKGLDDFVALAKLLDDRFRVVLVGMDPKQIRELAPGILGLPRTHNAAELAEIYTAADVFVNPSREETFGLTSYEASLCGTPVIVYRGTACEEIAKLYNGLAVDPNAQAICEAIQQFI